MERPGNPGVSVRDSHVRACRATAARRGPGLPDRTLPPHAGMLRRAAPTRPGRRTLKRPPRSIRTRRACPAPATRPHRHAPFHFMLGTRLVMDSVGDAPHRMIARHPAAGRESNRCRPAPARLRLLGALWVIAGLLYTPVHLALELHSDGSESAHGGASPDRATLASPDDHGGHHACHAAAQHPSQTTMAARLEVVKVAEFLVLSWVNLAYEQPRPRRLCFSGLSPPPHARCWQFLVRAALPARAPTRLA